MMKILVIGHAYVMDSNRRFWNVLAKENHAEVDIVVPKIWKSGLSKRIDYRFNSYTDDCFNGICPVPVFFKGKLSFFFFSPFRLASILWKKKYDVIFLYQESWALSVFFVLFMKFFSINKKTKIALNVHQNIKKQKLRFLHFYERIVSRNVDCFFYCSNEVRDVLIWKGIKTRCEYLALPFDDQKYMPSIPRRDLTEFKIGYLGRLEEDKGIRLLLESCDQLVKENIPFRLIIGGNGSLVEEIKKKNYVHYLGLVPHVEAYRFYEKIDCFVLPSLTRPNWKEQFGRVIVESLAAGKPVIGSSSGSIPEVLNLVGWPWIFNENSSSELAQLLIKLFHGLKNKEIRDQLSKAIENNYYLFSQAKVQRKVFNVFLDLIK